MRTKERLAEVLKQAGLVDMAQRAKAGLYDDYESEVPTPISLLVADLTLAGRPDLAQRARNGEWDGSREEANEWFAREGQYLLKKKG